MSIDFGSINWGFTATDILNNAMQLVTSVAPFILLMLALAFAPKLIGFMKSIVSEPVPTDDDEDGEDE